MSSYGQTPVISLSAGAGNAGSAITVPLTLSGGSNLAAMQWTLTYPSSAIASVSVSSGAAATAAAKWITCGPAAAQATCALAGVNQTTIVDGVIANVTFQLTPTATGVIPVQMSGVAAASPDAQAVSINGSGSSLTVTAIPVAPQLSALTCAPQALNPGGSSICTVSLTAAGTVATAISVSSSSTAVTSPTSVTVPAGSVSAQFTAMVSTAANTQTATITTSLGSSSKAASLSITANPAPQLNSLTCTPTAITGGASASCTVSLTAPAPPSGVIAALSSNNGALAVPSSIGVPSGSSSVQFSAAATSVSVAQTVTVAATAGGVSKSTTVTISAGSTSLFYLRGNSTEIIGSANGSLVTPTTGPAGFKGTLIARGTGYMTFAPVKDGDGVTFRPGGSQNTNTSFATFSGTPVGTIFNANSGEVSFYLKSSYSFAERNALPSNNSRWVFDVFDGNSVRVFYFNVLTDNNRLMFAYATGSSTGDTFYYVPVGQEDAAFGKGIVAKIRITWNGSQNILYVNDVPVKTATYTKTVPSWTAGSSLTFGAVDPHRYGGGYYSVDDAIAQFQVK